MAAPRLRPEATGTPTDRLAACAVRRVAWRRAGPSALFLFRAYFFRAYSIGGIAMGQHFLRSALRRVFSGHAAQHEMDDAVPHMAHCRPCWELAARVIAELRQEDLLVHPSDARGAVLVLLEEEERKAVNRLLTRGGWAELKGLAGEEQLDGIKADPSLQTQEMFDTLIEEASFLAQEDPHLGEETAYVAHALAGLLPESRFSEPFKNDLQSEAMLVIANSRRLVADWRGSAAALQAARSHLKRGTGEAVRQARLLSIQASLASNTGHLEQALALLARAVAIYDREEDTASVASVAVKVANTLLAACRHEEAVARAEEALSLLPPEATRLEMLARSILTESLVFLGRPAEALRSLEATRPLFKQLSGRRYELLLGYLEALVLDSFGHGREAEKAFRHNIAGFIEAELYKDAYLTMLTRFEILFRRGALDKAAEACQEALQMIEDAGAGCHSQLIELWRDLLTLVNARRLTEQHLLEARLYLARHWNAPAPRRPLGPPGGSPGVFSVVSRTDLNGNAVPAAPQEARPTDSHGGHLSAAPPAPRAELTGHYGEALERYDRELIAVALAQCGGRVRETSRLLDISRNTLRDKIKKYGLKTKGLAQSSEVQDPGPGRRLEEEERLALSRLRARAWWAEFRGLPSGQQLDRILTVSALHTREMFETVVEEAASLAQNDPPRGEAAALVAYALAGRLPEVRCPEPLRNDLQSEAMGIVANCRRLAGNWRGSAAALNAARGHLRRGSGELAREARLLSIQASLAADTGHLEQALTWLAQASAIYRKAGDSSAVASVMVKEANTLVAACRYEEAIGRAEDALISLSRKEARLEMLARSIITESLAALGRPSEALRCFLDTRLLYDRFVGRRSQLMVGYLEARLLECLGYSRQADAYYRAVVAGYMETEQYKEAFLILLTLFESLFRRGALDKAARACEEAIEMLEEAGTGYHSQIIEVWRDLLTLVRARQLTERELLAARHAIHRSGKAPVQGAFLDQSGEGMGAGAGDFELPEWDLAEAAISVGHPEPFSALAEPTGLAPENHDRLLLMVEAPDPVASLAERGYHAALERYDRQLIAEGLAQGRGQLAETARLLGIPRTTLRTKLKRYGLTGAESPVLSARRRKSRL